MVGVAEQLRLALANFQQTLHDGGVVQIRIAQIRCADRIRTVNPFTQIAVIRVLQNGKVTRVVQSDFVAVAPLDGRGFAHRNHIVLWNACQFIVSRVVRIGIGRIQNIFRELRL